MALKPVTDPNVLATLNAGEQAPATGRKPVTDPAVLAQLNTPSLDETVPLAVEPAAPAPAAPEPTLMERLKGAVFEDPILNMWASGLGTIAKGAPEAALTMGNNAGVQAVAGLTAPFVSQNDDDAANFVRDFTAENSYIPQGDSARQLEQGLGDAFAPLGNIKQKLGDVAMDTTGSPAVATAADMLPDILTALFGAESLPKVDTARRTRFDVPRGGELAETPAANPRPAAKLDVSELSGARENLPTPNTPVSPMVDQLRAADVRLRPSDVRAMVPGAKKVPGEFRERFADGPELKKGAILHNQQRFTDMAAKELGVKALDEASLAKAEAPAAATYDMVESVLREKPVSPEFERVFREGLDSIKLELPRGRPYTITGVLGAIRRRAAKRLQSDNPEMEAKGFADRNMADAIEEGLGNELQAAGEPQLFKEYQDARQQFAKVNDVRAATRAEQIDASTLSKIGKKTNKLSGRLQLIADASEYAPNVTSHSLKTAAREGAEVAGSKEGMIKGALKAGIRKIPGMDVGSESFQRTLGLPDEARTASYARPDDITPLRGPEQGGLDLREVLDLEAPPGEVGVALPSLMRKKPPTEQPDMLGSEFEFAAPPGEVGIPPPAQLSLQDLLGLGEPLAMKQPPGRVGKPKREK